MSERKKKGRTMRMKSRHIRNIQQTQKTSAKEIKRKFRGKQ